MFVSIFGAVVGSVGRVSLKEMIAVPELAENFA